MSQNKNILNYLSKGKVITPLDALKKFGCFRLSGRIYDLKKIGYLIQSIPIIKNGKNFCGYKLIGEKHE